MVHHSQSTDSYNPIPHSSWRYDWKITEIDLARLVEVSRVPALSDPVVTLFSLSGNAMQIITRHRFE